MNLSVNALSVQSKRAHTCILLRAHLLEGDLTLKNGDQQQLHIENLLGSGHFGNVYKAKKGGKAFAIKKVVNTERNTAHQEIKILKQVGHDHIIKYYDHFMEGKILCIVLEYADVGTMEKAVKQGRVRLEEYNVWRVTGQLSSALAYLHSRNPQPRVSLRVALPGG